MEIETVFFLNLVQIEDVCDLGKMLSMYWLCFIKHLNRIFIFICQSEKAVMYLVILSL